MVLSELFKKSIFFVLLLAISMNSYGAGIPDSISVSWSIEEDAVGTKNPISTMLISNSSSKDISCIGWSLWFNFMRGINTGSLNKEFKIEHKNGDLYQLSFIDKNLVVPANSSLAVAFKTKGLLPNFTDAPTGFYLQYDNSPDSNIRYQILF